MRRERLAKAWSGKESERLGGVKGVAVNGKILGYGCQGIERVTGCRDIRK